MELKWYDWMAIILVSLMLIMLTWKVFGSSPSEVQLYITILLGLGGLVFRNAFAISKLNREVGEMHINMKNSFNNAKRDMDELKSLIKRRK